MMSSTSAVLMPVRSASARNTVAPSCCGWMPAKAPLPALPMPRGVRHASMISASTLLFPSVSQSLLITCICSRSSAKVNSPGTAPEHLQHALPSILFNHPSSIDPGAGRLDDLTPARIFAFDVVAKPSRSGRARDHAEGREFLADLVGLNDLDDRGAERLDPILWRRHWDHEAEPGRETEAGETLLGQGRRIGKGRYALRVAARDQP